MTGYSCIRRLRKRLFTGRQRIVPYTDKITLTNNPLSSGTRESLLSHRVEEIARSKPSQRFKSTIKIVPSLINGGKTRRRRSLRTRNN
jgi:hypothetical protein